MEQSLDYQAELKNLLHTSISSLAGLCDEQMLLSIYVAGINKGIAIGREQSLRAENDKLTQIGGRRNLNGK